MERQLGEILYWNRTKAIGFICGLGDRNSYFFHITHIALVNGARAIPSVGDLYTFSTKESTRIPGKTDAVDLHLSKRLKPATAAPTPEISAKEIR